MTNAEIKELLDWFLPRKIKTRVLRLGERLRNYCCNDQSLFQKNAELKGLEAGNRCFILGTGASTNRQDLTLLKDEITIALAGFFLHKDIDVIKPKYYVVNSVFRLHGKYLDEQKFINWLTAMDETLDDGTIMFMEAGDKPYLDKHNLFRNKPIYWYQVEYYDEDKITHIDLQHLQKPSSASEVAISIALVLEFDKIYLLGCDLNGWFCGPDNPYYFDDERYNKYFEISRAETMEKHGLDNLYQLQGCSKIFYKYKQLQSLKHNIYNANSNQDTYVDTFPKVKYDELFN